MLFPIGIAAYGFLSTIEIAATCAYLTGLACMPEIFRRDAGKLEAAGIAMFAASGAATPATAAP
jgi:hypothetical protein